MSYTSVNMDATPYDSIRISCQNMVSLFLVVTARSYYSIHTTAGTIQNEIFASRDINTIPINVASMHINNFIMKNKNVLITFIVPTLITLATNI